MIWLIVFSLFFVILGSCQSQHEGSKNNILDPYISKPPALGEETGGENRGIVGDMITGGLKEILRPKGPGGGYYPNGGGGYYPNAGGGHHPSAAGAGAHNPSAGSGGAHYPTGAGAGGAHYPTGAGAGAHTPSAAGAGANYQYGESETEQQDFPDYSTINNMESNGVWTNMSNPFAANIRKP